MNTLAEELKTPEAAANVALILLGLCDYLNQYVGGHVVWDAFSAATLLKALERGKRVAADAGTLAAHGLGGFEQRVPARLCSCDDCGGHFSVPGAALVCGRCSLDGCTH